jgi:hypothetical protein
MDFTHFDAKGDAHMVDVSEKPMTKPMINFWWDKQDFRLKLKGYEGNCKWCWKKSTNKLLTICIENPEYFDFPKRMEEKFSDFIPESRKQNEKLCQNRWAIPSLSR